jgi:hypothetical protein
MTLDSGQSSAAITHFSNPGLLGLLQHPQRAPAGIHADKNLDTLLNPQQLSAPGGPLPTPLSQRPLSSSLQYAPQVMRRVQCQLGLLYNSYVSSRTMYLQQAQVLLGELHRSCQHNVQPDADSESTEAIGAVSRAVQTAMKIMKASTDVERAWQYSGRSSTALAAIDVQYQGEVARGQLQDQSSGHGYLCPTTAVSGQASQPPWTH